MAASTQLGGGVPLLDIGTQNDGGLRATVYPSAGELVVVGAQRPRPDDACGLRGVRRLTLPDEERGRRDQYNAERANRRARGRLRRYCRANRVSHLWTLTYANERHHVDEVTDDLKRFSRALRDEGIRQPWARVIERGERTSRLHAHWCTDRFVPIDCMRDLWGHGHVLVKHHHKTKGGSTARASVIASYLASYVNEGLGAKSYEVARGFQPVNFKYTARTESDAIGLAASEFFDGEAPAYDWNSSTEQDWRGPFTRFLSWERG